MKVLFVCLGNICRSPTVEGVARILAAREVPQLDLQFDSAGTAGYHIGSPPDPRSCVAAAGRGYDISGLRARQLQREDFTRFDLLLAMDRDNLAAMQQLSPAGERHRVRLFLSLLGKAASADVPDPYYGGPEDFQKVLDLAEAGSRALFVAVAAQGAAARTDR
ncbi:MAG: low molecular weight protein-tyrosine-phosphatase [Steroidobacteraceae bacterium]